MISRWRTPRDVAVERRLARRRRRRSGVFGGKYGPIALYVGGTGEARFKDVAYADLNARPFDEEKVSSNFRVRRLSEFYYWYRAAIADFKHDGNNDVIAGPYYYLGPTSKSAGRSIRARRSIRRRSIRSRRWSSSPTTSPATGGRTS